VEPIAFAVEVEKGTVETALVIPTGVLALGYDSIRERVLGGTAAPSPTAAPAPAEPER
jgi:energy-converting hydrogenase Eha subunit A